MSKHATKFISDAERERQMNDLAPPEEMERRRELVARMRARMAIPATEAEKRIWKEFVADLERDRPKFR